MRKERHYLISTATPTTTPSSPKGAKRVVPQVSPALIIVLLVIVAVATGVGYVATSGGATTYACIDIAHQGSSLTVTTTGLVHFLKQQYYISCTEGSNLPTNAYKSSCLIITPLLVTAPIGTGASTDYYYLSSSSGSAITLVGAAPLTNGTEIIPPAAISLSVSC
jgi:hypothetical protein